MGDPWRGLAPAVHCLPESKKAGWADQTSMARSPTRRWLRAARVRSWFMSAPPPRPPETRAPQKDKRQSMARMARRSTASRATVAPTGRARSDRRSLIVDTWSQRDNAAATQLANEIDVATQPIE